MTKTDFDNKLRNLHRKINSNKAKHLLVENKFKKLHLIQDLFIGQSYIDNDGAPLILIFQPIYETITTFSGLWDTISELESKGLSNETSIPTYTKSKSLSPKLVWCNSKIELKFKGICLKQDKETFTPKNVIYMVT